MPVSTRKRISILEAGVACCVGLASARLLMLASVPVVLLMPLMFILAFLQDVGVIGAFPLDIRGVIPWLTYLWYALCVALALVVMDGSRIVDPSGAQHVRLYWRKCWRRASWFSKGATLLIVALMCVCLAWPLVEGYQLTAYSRAGAKVAYEFGEDNAATTRTLDIDFSASEVDDRVVLTLKSSFDASEPFRLDLSGTGVTDQGIIAFLGNQNLVSLDLDNTAITDAGVAKLADCVSLRELSLNGTMVTDNSIEPLTRFIELQNLGLVSTQVSDAGVLGLQSIGSLQRLTLCSSISEQTVQQLREARPRIQVYRVAAADTDEAKPPQRKSSAQQWIVLSLALLVVLALGIGPFYLAYRDTENTDRFNSA